MLFSNVQIRKIIDDYVELRPDLRTGLPPHLLTLMQDRLLMNYYITELRERRQYEQRLGNPVQANSSESEEELQAVQNNYL